MGRRFGGNKLHGEINGVSMIDRALDTLSASGARHVAVVSADGRILSAARRHGFIGVDNAAPEEGISRSIRIGIDALGDMDALMFMVADQPMLSPGSLIRLAAAHRQTPDCIAALSFNGKRGNPVIFPSDLFGELRALNGDTGGSAVIARHPERLILVETAREELLDIDDRSALEEVNRQALYPRLDIRLYTTDKCFGPGISHLLRLVMEQGSLRSAAASMNMSYSKAWSIVKRCEELLGFPLLLRSTGGKNGGGARLTSQAELILEQYSQYCSDVDRAAKELFKKRFADYL